MELSIVMVDVNAIPFDIGGREEAPLFLFPLINPFVIAGQAGKAAHLGYKTILLAGDSDRRFPRRLVLKGCIGD